MKFNFLNLKSILDFIVNLLFLLVLAAALLLFVPRAMGMNTYAVLSSSMEPTLPVGSIIYTTPYSGTEQMEEMDIIAYEAGTSLVAHRVLSIDKEKGAAITQGDANKVPDQSPVYMKDVIGQVRFQIPILGYALMMLQEDKGRFLIILAAGIVIFLAIVSDQLKTADNKKSRRNSYEKEN